MFCLNESAEREVGSPDEWARSPPPAGRCGWRSAAGTVGVAMVVPGRRRVVGAGESGRKRWGEPTVIQLLAERNGKINGFSGGFPESGT
jgi:hypothetical protein